jgi:hypothetical protein
MHCSCDLPVDLVGNMAGGLVVLLGLPFLGGMVVALNGGKCINGVAMRNISRSLHYDQCKGRVAIFLTRNLMGIGGLRTHIRIVSVPQSPIRHYSMRSQLSPQAGAVSFGHSNVSVRAPACVCPNEGLCAWDRGDSRPS